MSKQAKKRPKPVEPIPCEWWGIYGGRGQLIYAMPNQELAEVVRERCKGKFLHRVRIVPVVAKAKRRKPKRRTVDVMKELQRDMREVNGVAKRRKGAK